ncbi:MAG: ATP-dependent RecD-like DNA helicase [Clostridia bacterium]|nr:ATP-dependent RecD-like DNA helicase [Clostridia bacterium]
MDEIITIDGTIESVTYQNTESGYTVLDFVTSDGESFIAVGNLGNLVEGESVTFTGTFVFHPKYGKQLKVESCIRKIPETADEMFIFLSAGTIRGIGVKTAQKIIDAFGEKTFDVIENEPDRLAKIKGITKERAREISREFKVYEGERRAIISLEKFGMKTNEAIKVYNLFGARSAEVVENNPYMLCNLGIRISFDRADEIAANLPKPPLDEYRIQGGVLYVMRHNLGNGHTCVPRSSLFAPCMDLLGCSEDDVDIQIDNLIAMRRLVTAELRGKDFIFLPDLYNAEHDSARALLFMKRYATKSMGDIDDQIKMAQVAGGVVFNDLQIKAIKIAVEKGILVLTGGPGTGKTTTVRGILRVLENQGVDVALAAPTGRAAKRMSEVTGKEALTIHRLLEVEWDENDRPKFQRNKRNPLDCGAIIVDELSMVDVQLFSSLLDALPIGCRLIMVGDSDQLPPVGAGNVLHDIIESNVIDVVELNQVFRQAMESLIITNAHKIVAGEMPELDIKDKDFFFMEKQLPSNAAQTIVDLLDTRLPSAYNYSPIEDIQVLCPSRKGETGTINLNKLLQERLNPPHKKKKEVTFGSRIFREGDKLMQIKNNYNIQWHNDVKEGEGVFNGDIGILLSIDTEYEILTIRFDDRVATIPFESSIELEHAYAITVHKSQGSEFPAVVIPVVGVNDLLLYRNLLYTAVTRAKELLILVGNRQTVQTMVDNNKKQRRYSSLRDYIVRLGEEK